MPFSLILSCSCFACLLALPAGAIASPLSLHEARQLVVVITPSWDEPTGRLYTFERSDNGWQQHGAGFAVALGRNGSAWGMGLHPAQPGEWPRKREGDGRSPAGVFTIGQAFGYVPHIDSPWFYQQMQATHYCMDVAASPLYNRIVDSHEVGAETVAASTEPMRLDLHNNGDVRYALGFVIEHNQDNIPERGSCIFAHLWRQPGEGTAGCTAMSPEHMTALLAWLKPEAGPRFVLLPQAEYQRLHHDWGLPSPTATSASSSMFFEQEP